MAGGGIIVGVVLLVGFNLVGMAIRVVLLRGVVFGGLDGRDVVLGDEFS